MLKSLLFVALVGWGGWHWWTTHDTWPTVDLSAAPALKRPRVSVAHPPVQRELAGPVAPFVLQDYRLLPRAQFHLRARVLSAKHHDFGRSADVVPVDLALGWGPMAQEPILSHFEIWQAGGFYHWRARTLPIPRREVIISSANMHMIPSSTAVRRALEAVQPGQQVTVRGWLVDIEGPGGWRWNTSLTRDDSGKGGCEVVLVADIGLQ